MTKTKASAARIIVLSFACLFGASPHLFSNSKFETSSIPDDPITHIGFCGTHIREFEACGHWPQKSMPAKEFVSEEDYKSPIITRTPFGIVQTYGQPQHALQPDILKSVLWFVDADGTIRNVTMDLNITPYHVLIKRKGYAVVR